VLGCPFSRFFRVSPVFSPYLPASRTGFEKPVFFWNVTTFL
jgi:hypothetical protein